MSNRIFEIMNRITASEKPVHIKLLGDSITHGVGGTGFCQSGEKIYGDFSRNPDGYCWANKFQEYMQTHYACTVTNNACSGTTIAFVIKHLEELVSAEDDLIICTIGTNDRHHYFDKGEKPEKEEYFKAFTDKIACLHQKLLEMGKEVIFVANIPASLENEKDGEDYWRILHMDDIQKAYLQVAEERGFPLICLYRLFLETCRGRGIDYETLLADGLHPNDAGYDLIFELMMRQLGLQQ